MFESYPNIKNYTIKQAEANFSDGFFWVQKPLHIYQELLERLDLLQQPIEPNAESLCRIIADHYQIPEKSVMVFQGLQSAIYHITQLVRETSCTIVSPAAPYFEEASKYFRLKVFFNETPHHYGSFKGVKLAFLSNPGIVDGCILYTDELEDMIGGHPETIFVLDETFIDFCKYTSSVADLVRQYDNLIVIKSLSDRGGLPSLNLSYLTAHKRITETLKKRDTSAFD